MSALVHKSVLEDKFPIFPEDSGAGNRKTKMLIDDMNRIQVICAGLGAVMRIVGGNSVLQANFDPSTDSEPPLSQTAIDSLTNMAAELLEGISNDIMRRANSFEGNSK